MLDTVSLLLYTEGTTKKRGIRIMWWDETREKELEMDNRKLRARIEKLGTELRKKDEKLRNAEHKLEVERARRQHGLPSLPDCHSNTLISAEEAHCMSQSATVSEVNTKLKEIDHLIKEKSHKGGTSITYALFYYKDNRLLDELDELVTQLKDKGYRADIGHSSYSTLINIQW